MGNENFFAARLLRSDRAECITRSVGGWDRSEFDQSRRGNSGGKQRRLVSFDVQLFGAVLRCQL
jgi:hypothetical protein